MTASSVLACSGGKIVSTLVNLGRGGSGEHGRPDGRVGRATNDLRCTFTSSHDPEKSSNRLATPFFRQHQAATPGFCPCIMSSFVGKAPQVTGAGTVASASARECRTCFGAHLIQLHHTHTRFARHTSNLSCTAYVVVDKRLARQEPMAPYVPQPEQQEG